MAVPAMVDLRFELAVPPAPRAPWMRIDLGVRIDTVHVVVGCATAVAIVYLVRRARRRAVAPGSAPELASGDAPAAVRPLR